jgi:hypothetical protein
MFADPDFKNAMGGLAVVIMFVAYGVQLWKTYDGKCEPHPLAWAGFGFLTGVGYLVQAQKGAAAGGWVMGVTALFCFAVALMSQYKKRWRISDFDNWDWTALIAGVGLFILYLISRNLSWGPLASSVLATSADLVLYLPIFIRSAALPEKESATAYALNSLKFVPSLFAMSHYSVETWLYPSALVIINACVVLFLLVRRQQLHDSVPARLQHQPITSAHLEAK